VSLTGADEFNAFLVLAKSCLKSKLEKSFHFVFCFDADVDLGATFTEAKEELETDDAVNVS
jgi:hypothetical protein